MEEINSLEKLRRLLSVLQIECGEVDEPGKDRPGTPYVITNRVSNAGEPLPNECEFFEPGPDDGDAEVNCESNVPQRNREPLCYCLTAAQWHYYLVTVEHG